jgi:hypothetical protein
VVQRRHAGDHAERRGLKRAGEEVAAHELDLAVKILPAGQLDTRGVLVDAYHMQNAAGELPDQHPLTTAHIQHPLAARRDRRQDQRIAVGVVIPPPVLAAHRP